MYGTGTPGTEVMWVLVTEPGSSACDRNRRAASLARDWTVLTGSLWPGTCNYPASTSQNARL